MTTDPLTWIADELDQLEKQSLRRQRTVRENAGEGAKVVWNGTTYANFGSNDYLGLAGDARIRQAVEAAIASHGWGSGASPVVSGRTDLHAQLEHRLAAFEGTESALLFSSGYAANAGSIPALVGPGDVVFSDARNHASIIDGCKLSGATVRVYRHLDTDDLAVQLTEVGQARRKLIVTDSLFSMDGDVAPLAEISGLAREHGAMLLVDEAHATGVLGPSGRGACEAAHIEDVAIRVGTLSKAFGSHGGFVVGSQRLVDWLANRARPYFFSTSAPAAIAAAGLAAIEIVQSEPNRRIQLLRSAENLRSRLRANGWNVGRSTGQIIPVMVGDPSRALSLAAKLREQGVYVPAIRPPSVPPGESLLRISLSYAHGETDLDQLIESLGKSSG
jgi:8-amino-7-oxononanoate synthase